MSTMHKYNNLLKKCNIKIKCVLCNLTKLPRHMKNHLKNEHMLPCSSRCPWCLEIAWKRSEKFNHFEHRYYCLSKKKKEAEYAQLRNEYCNHKTRNEAIDNIESNFVSLIKQICDNWKNEM